MARRLLPALLLCVACGADEGMDAPADAAPPTPDSGAAADAAADADPTPRCRAGGCAWHPLVSGTSADILTFIVGARGELRAATTAGSVWIAPGPDGSWAPLEGERPPLGSYVEREGGLAVGTVAGETRARVSGDGGAVFAPVNVGAIGPLAQVIDAFGTFVAVGGSPVEIDLWSGEAGVRWSSAELPDQQSQLLAAAAMQTLTAPFTTLAVGTLGGKSLVVRSTNFSGGFSAVAVGMAGSATLRAVAWNGRVPGVAVATGDAGTILRSPDGATWVKVPAVTGNDLLAVRAVGGGALFVAAGKGGAIALSADGETWTAASAGAADLRAVASDGVRVYAAGAGGALWASDPL